MSNILFGNLRLYLIVIIVNLLSLLGGLMKAWPTPVLAILSTNETLGQNPIDRLLTDKERIWIVYLASLGGIVGPPLSGLIMHKFGRKLAIAGAYVPNIFACLFAAFGNRIWHFYVSRVAAGISIYCGVTVVAVYLVEISDKRIRGIMYSSAPLLISTGMLMCFCIGPYTSVRNLNLIILAFVVLGLTATWYIPETPQFLLQTHRVATARESLEILRNSNDIQSEFMQMQAHVARTEAYPVFQSKAMRKSLRISLVMLVLGSFSGSIAIYSYALPIFKLSGSKLSASASWIIIEIVQIFSTCLTTIGVDWFGRKKMLAFSSFGLAFVLGILGTYFRFKDENLDNFSVINWMPLVFLMTFFVIYNSGIRSLPFLYITEIIPLKGKCLGTGVLMALDNVLGLLLSFFYSSIVRSIGMSGCFYVFSMAMLSFALYILIYMIETKGKALEEIYGKLNKSKRSQNACSQDGVKKTEEL